MNANFLTQLCVRVTEWFFWRWKMTSPSLSCSQYMYDCICSSTLSTSLTREARVYPIQSLYRMGNLKLFVSLMDAIVVVTIATSCLLVGQWHRCKVCDTALIWRLIYICSRLNTINSASEPECSYGLYFTLLSCLRHTSVCILLLPLFVSKSHMTNLKFTILFARASVLSI